MEFMLQQEVHTTIMGRPREGRRHWRVAMRIRITLPEHLLSRSNHLCLISFPYKAGKIPVALQSNIYIPKHRHAQQNLQICVFVNFVGHDGVLEYIHLQASRLLFSGCRLE